MSNIWQFRAVRKIGRAGVFGAVLLLLGNAALAQSSPEEEPSSPAETQEGMPNNQTVHLKFLAADWPTVLKKVAEESDSILIMHEVPPGRFGRRDKEPYTRHEAVQILNHELEPEGFRILENNEYLIVLHQRSLRTRYPRPKPPKPTEWHPDPAANRQFDPPRVSKRSVTPIATRETQPPAKIQLATNAKPIPTPVPAVSSTEKSTNPIAAAEAPPANAAGLPAGWSFTVLSPRNRVRDLAGSLFKALESKAQLFDRGINGLPAFRVQFPSPVENGGLEGFEVGIDIAKNQILLASTPKRLRQLTSLFQYVDRETNEFQQPIRLVAADETTAQLAQELTPQLNRIAGKRKNSARCPWLLLSRNRRRTIWSKNGAGPSPAQSPATARERGATADQFASRAFATHATGRNLGDYREFPRGRANPGDSRIGNHDFERQSGRCGCPD